MTGTAFAFTLTLQLLAELSLPGTQPNELAQPPEPSSSCNCHQNFDTATFTEPGQSYRATPMAMAARDPLFRAALVLAAEDAPGASDVCIRCHSPIGWLSGRSVPGDGSALIEIDLESVTCDLCHRMVPHRSGYLIGDGQYTVSPSSNKRAARGAMPENGHLVETSTYTGSSELCGVCHSLFNPLETAYDARGNSLGINYYEQRTYEEWKDSRFSEPGGKSCAGCHLKRVRGRACRQGVIEYGDLSLHAIVGGNYFLPQAVNVLDPLTYPITNELDFVLREIDETLRSAATLEIRRGGPVEASGRDTLSLPVRLTNNTGHKLPTGYPEGRRIYLELSLSLPGMGTRVLSGAWEQASGNLQSDPQLRTYETIHERYENGSSARTRRLLQLNQVYLDTRIPPEGFRPHAPDMIPEGRDYGTAPYRHWDEFTYQLALPDVQGTVTGTITVRAMYQVTDGAYVNHLLSSITPGHPARERLSMAWEQTQHAPPREMGRADVRVVIRQRVDPPDAGQVDMGETVDPPAGVEGGCNCAVARTEHGSAALLFFAALALVLRFARRAWPGDHR